MTDSSHPSDRDPQIARWLEVEPLDDVTRARMVRVAVEGTRPSATRMSRVVGAAAALLVVVAVGVGVLATRNGDAPTPRATPASRGGEEPGATAAVPDARTAAPESLDAEAPLPELPSVGSLGDVSDRADLRAAVATLPPPGRDRAVAPCAVEAARALGTPIAVGTGTVAGSPATVVVVEAASGATEAVAVVDATCRPGPSTVAR